MKRGKINTNRRLKMKHSSPAVTTIGAEVQTTVEEEEAVFSTVQVEDPMVDSTDLHEALQQHGWSNLCGLHQPILS